MVPSQLSKHRENAEVLRNFYTRPAVKEMVRLFQKTFEHYWKKENSAKRKAEKLERRLQSTCSRLIRKSDCKGMTIIYPRVDLLFEHRAMLALHGLLGMSRDDKRTQPTIVWFKWLVRNWDLHKDNVPNLPPEIVKVEPQLSDFAIYVGPRTSLSAEQGSGSPWHLHSWVMAQVFPGVSHRDLQRCMKEVYHLVNAQSDGKGIRRSKGGAPSGLASWQWQEAFEQFGPVLKGISTRIPKIQSYIEDQFGVHYSKSQIRTKYEAFLEKTKDS